jgi:GNAT superfamily N-acetyltransferase
MNLTAAFGLARGDARPLSIDLARRPVRCPPWRWLRTRVERLRAPIDFEPVGHEHEHSSPPPQEVQLAGARSPVGADDSVATDRAPIGSMRSEGTALRLRNGRGVRVRPVQPVDAEGVQEFVRRLSDTSRRLRFFAPIRELAPAMLARLTGSAGRRGPVLVAEAHDGDTSCIVALAEYAVGDDDGTCELAFVVADAWQRLGLGHALMGMLIQAAREARCVRAVADVLYGNEAMVALCHASGFAFARSPHGSTMLRLVRDLQDPPPPNRVRISAGGAPQLCFTAAFAAS